MNKYLVIFLLAILASCGIKTRTLLNGVTKVPTDEFFAKKYRSYDPKLELTKLDTSGYYFSSEDNSGWISIYKFYSNGKCNWFYTTKDKISQSNTFDPSYNGYRGFWYSNEQNVVCYLYAPGDQLRQIKKIQRMIFVNNDSIYVKREFNILDTFIRNTELNSSGIEFKSW
jgi:hypothetical protein